jgi:hypothetical protein
MTLKVRWFSNLRAFSAIAIMFHIGCSENDNNNEEQFVGQTAGSTQGVMTNSAGSGALIGTGGTQASGTGGTANKAGVGGSVIMKATGGKSGSAGASGKSTVTAGRSAAGAGGSASGGGKAGQTGNAGNGNDPCGADAKTASGTSQSRGYGGVNIYTSTSNEIVKLTTTLTVPKEPQPRQGTLFLWPGLEPLSSSYFNVGVLQPVLTWGTSCAPNGIISYDTWWIAGMFVTMMGTCEGGGVMKVKVGDKLDIEMVLNGTTWKQIVTNRSNGNSVDFDRDMQGQKQQWGIFSIEMPTGGGNVKPVDDVVFTSAVVQFKDSEPNACIPREKGATDYYSPPRVSSDGKTCCYSKITLRAQGSAATTKDTP